MYKSLIYSSAFCCMFFLTSTLSAKNLNYEQKKEIEVDVLVYGATPSGIMSAYSVRKAGLTVLIIEPGRWVGGILGAGLKPTQDMPNYSAIGGKTRELMLSLGVRSEKKDLSIEDIRKLSRTEISPKYVREDFLKFLKDTDIGVIFDHRINRIRKEGATIKEAVFDTAPFDETGCPAAEAREYESLKVKAKIFIDAGYEGDLMARSGVSFQVGRESTKDYDEEFAGVRPIGTFESSSKLNETASGHGLGNITPISPFRIHDDPKSGLLPLVENDHLKKLGAGDYYTQAYNFRFYVTSDPSRAAKITPPKNYSPNDFELVGRYVDYLKNNITDERTLFERLTWIFPGWLNAGEYNYHRRSLFTMAPLGISHIYANGDYASKAAIWKQHQEYLSGLHHFMSTDARIPQKYKAYVASLGLDRYHHPETNGWPHQLYIRVSRRLVGEYTITEHDVYNRTKINDPVGLAQYGLDTYPSRRIWFTKNDSLFVALEGNMFVGGASGPTNIPYPIAYRSLTPLKHECTNLLVPVLFSSTHLGYASARMEPTFMITGESAGIAAVQAIRDKVPVQDININRFLYELRKKGQLLENPSR